MGTPATADLIPEVPTSKINPEIRAFLSSIMPDLKTDEEFLETLTDETPIYRGSKSSHRWWDVEFQVVEIAGKHIGFYWGVTTGDDSARDKGWEFDYASICWADPKEVTKTIYVPRK